MPVPWTHPKHRIAGTCDLESEEPPFCREMTMDRDRLDTAASRLALGRLLQPLGQQTADVKQLCRQCLEIREVQLGPQHA